MPDERRALWLKARSTGRGLALIGKKELMTPASIVTVKDYNALRNKAVEILGDEGKFAPDVIAVHDGAHPGEPVTQATYADVLQFVTQIDRMLLKNEYD